MAPTLIPPVDAGVAVPSLRTLGTGAQQATAGNDSRLSDSRAPSGSAGGDLTGTYPNPTIGSGKVTSAMIADGTIVNADVNASAAIAYSKLALGTSIVNADVSASAAIAYSKLALSTSIVQGDLAAALVTALSGFSTAWTVIVKASDTSRNSTTTPSADPELAFTAASGGLYDYEAYIIYVSASGAGTPDIKIGWGEDNTARGVMIPIEYSTADAARASPVLGQQNAGDAAGTAAANRAIIAKGHHVGAGGSFALAWAQNTSSGSPNDTTVKAGSVLRYRRIL